MSAPASAVERCERCSAHAKQKVTVHTHAELGDLVFLFCQHHYDEQRKRNLHKVRDVDVEPLHAAAVV